MSGAIGYGAGQLILVPGSRPIAENGKCEKATKMAPQLFY